MRKLLTKRLLAQVKPDAKPYEIRDTQAKGLLIRVQPSGHMSWIVEWGRGKRRTLAATSHLSLEDARKQANKALSQVVCGALSNASSFTISPTI